MLIGHLALSQHSLLPGSTFDQIAKHQIGKKIDIEAPATLSDGWPQPQNCMYGTMAQSIAHTKQLPSISGSVDFLCGTQSLPRSRIAQNDSPEHFLRSAADVSSERCRQPGCPRGPCAQCSSKSMASDQLTQYSQMQVMSICHRPAVDLRQTAQMPTLRQSS